MSNKETVITVQSSDDAFIRHALSAQLHAPLDRVGRATDEQGSTFLCVLKKHGDNLTSIFYPCTDSGEVTSRAGASFQGAVRLRGVSKLVEAKANE